MDDQGRGLLDAAARLVGELDLEVVIDRLMASARELTDARYAALGVLNDAKTELERFITAGIGDDARAHIGELPRGRGVLGELILAPEPLRLADVGDHPRSYGFPLGHPPMRSFLGVPILAGGVPFGSLYLTEKAGGVRFTDADEQSATTLARFAGAAIDHARRFTGAAAHRDELARRVAAFEATAQITRAVAGATDIEVILGLVAKRGRALVSARALVIELVDGDELVVAAVAGGLPAGVVGARIPIADTVASAALRTHTTQRLEVELNRARFDQYDAGPLGVSVDAGLVVPLVFREQTYGAVIAIERLRDGPAFSVEDQRLLEAFANSAAAAVATAQAAAAELHRQRLAATEDERRRWARELHDETLQSLAGLRIGLAAAHRTGGREVLKDAVGEAIIWLEEGIFNLRALVSDLRAGALDDLGLEAAVHALCDRAGRHGLQIDCSLDLAYEQGRAPTRHTAELETTIYRISQEALTNAAKHGHAQRVVVEIAESQTTIELTVRDDGAGFDPTSSTAGFGLLGMRERVQLLGGTAHVHSAVGEGTRVTARFPVQRRPASPAAATSLPIPAAGPS
ncbi:MAG: GAF domain-containing protein [Solirubrobacteraceae bacterium]